MQDLHLSRNKISVDYACMQHGLVALFAVFVRFLISSFKRTIWINRKIKIYPTPAGIILGYTLCP